MELLSKWPPNKKTYWLDIFCNTIVTQIFISSSTKGLPPLHVNPISKLWHMLPFVSLHKLPLFFIKKSRIDQSHIFQTSPAPYPTIHHSELKCAHLHNGICALGLLFGIKCNCKKIAHSRYDYNVKVIMQRTIQICFNLVCDVTVTS